jgi:hypothetical protein
MCESDTNVYIRADAGTGLQSRMLVTWSTARGCNRLESCAEKFIGYPLRQVPATQVYDEPGIRIHRNSTEVRYRSG